MQVTPLIITTHLECKINNIQHNTETNGYKKRGTPFVSNDAHSTI